MDSVSWHVLSVPCMSTRCVIVLAERSTEATTLRPHVPTYGNWLVPAIFMGICDLSLGQGDSILLADDA